MSLRLHSVVLLPIVLFFIAGCHPKGESSEKDSAEIVKDANGETYRTVEIGTQRWMAENLNATRYRNGDAIPYVKDERQWESFNEGAFCYHDNSKKSGRVYGRLYNWHAVNDPRGICPVGWHIPTDEEWQQLADYLGGNRLAGDKMKEAGTRHWAVPNAGATNLSGFSALPGGGRDEFGKFIIDKYGGYWWSSTDDGGVDVWVRSIFYGYGSILRDGFNKNCGFSVRCLKNL